MGRVGLVRKRRGLAREPHRKFPIVSKKDDGADKEQEEVQRRGLDGTVTRIVDLQAKPSILVEAKVNEEGRRSMVLAQHSKVHLAHALVKSGAT